MQSPSHLVTGAVWLGVGVVLLFSWRQLYESAFIGHARITRFLRLPLGSERFYRLFTRFVVIVFSVVCLLTAIANFEQAFTGRESWLRTAQWRDLWPF